MEGGLWLSELPMTELVSLSNLGVWHQEIIIVHLSCILQYPLSQ